MGAGSRYGAPLYIPSLDSRSTGQRLKRIPFQLNQKGDYNEAWMQSLLFDHPEILPFSDIDPSFANAVPICRELPTRVGPVDLLYANEEGLLTLVECKLWRNSEARREVIGQILDYAKEISTWGYEELADAVSRGTRHGKDELLNIVAQSSTELDEANFVDGVTRNLRQGKFLLLVVGDGIREDLERLKSFLDRHVGLRFTFALVELALYQADPSGYFLQPRVLARTVEIPRAIVDLRSEQVHVSDPLPEEESEPTVFAQLQTRHPATAARLQGLFSRLRTKGYVISEKRSLIIHWKDGGYSPINFGSIFPDGTIRTNYIAETAAQLGAPEIADAYLDGVAALIPDAEVRRVGTPWTWKVIVRGRDPRVEPLLDHEDEWIALIESARLKLRARRADA